MLLNRAVIFFFTCWLSLTIDDPAQGDMHLAPEGFEFESQIGHMPGSALSCKI